MQILNSIAVIRDRLENSKGLMGMSDVKELASPPCQTFINYEFLLRGTFYYDIFVF